jgi:type II secretory pathway pseudopilin PulG
MINKIKGFTIIEIIVVLAIFLFVIGAAIGIFISIVKNQKMILSEQQFLNQVSYVQEYMSKALRMAKSELSENCLQDTTISDEYHPGFVYLLTRYDVNFGTYKGIKFLNQSDNGTNGQPPACQEFFWDDEDGSIKEIKNGSSPVQLTSSDLRIKEAKFVVNGVVDQTSCSSPCGASWCTGGSCLQPRVTILLKFFVIADTAASPTPCADDSYCSAGYGCYEGACRLLRSFQTTVSQRNLNAQ